MSQNFEDTKRAVWTSLSHVIRTSALKDAPVSFQTLMIIVERTMDAIGPAGPFDLSPTLEAMRDQGLDEEACYEALIAFHDREEQLGFPIQLPKELEVLSKEKKHRLLLRYQKRQRGTRPREAPKAAEGAPEIPTSMRQGGNGPRTRPVITASFLLTLVAAGGMLYWRHSTQPPPVVPVVVNDPGALPCAALTGNGKMLLCRLPAAARKGMTDTDFRTRGRTTVTAASGLGYERLVVLQHESGRVLGSF